MVGDSMQGANQTSTDGQQFSQLRQSGWQDSRTQVRAIRQTLQGPASHELWNDGGR